MWLMQSIALALAALLLVGVYVGLPQFHRYRAPPDDRRRQRDPA
jgi:hypothetical protein